MKGVATSSYFLWKLLPFDWKKDFTTYYIILYVVFLSILMKNIQITFVLDITYKIKG